MPPIVVVNERMDGVDLQTVAVGGYHGAQEVFCYVISQSLKESGISLAQLRGHFPQQID